MVSSGINISSDLSDYTVCDIQQNILKKNGWIPFLLQKMDVCIQIVQTWIAEMLLFSCMSRTFKNSFQLYLERKLFDHHRKIDYENLLNKSKFRS